MNQDQIAGIVRILVPSVCAWLAAKGLPWLGNADVVAQVTTAVIAGLAVAWSIWRHTNAQKLKAAADVDPGVQITVPQKVADADSKVKAVVADASVPNVTSQP